MSRAVGAPGQQQKQQQQEEHEQQQQQQQQQQQELKRLERRLEQQLHLQHLHKCQQRCLLLPALGATVDEDDELEILEVDAAIERLLSRKPRLVPSRKPTVQFKHRDPDNPLWFGRWFGSHRAPVALLESCSPAVAEYLRKDPDGPFADLQRNPPVAEMSRESVWGQWFFQQDEKEKTLKADWHSVPHLGSRCGLFVPRRAEWSSVTRAPPRIAAFMMAFRAVNQPLWSAIIDALTGLRLARERESEEYRAEGRGKLLGVFAECFKNQRHFGIVEAQVRFGVRGRQPSHKDGATSLLHMGLTLGGRRTLRAGLFPTGECPANFAAEELAPKEEDGEADESERDKDGTGKEGVWNADVWKAVNVHCQTMVPGSVYLSSPFLFEHAVQYEDCSPEEPMIALMARWGFPEDLGKHVNEMRTEDMLDIVAVITGCLQVAGSRGQIRMPSLDEVKQGEARLRHVDADLAEKAAQARRAREEQRKLMPRKPQTYVG